jgi:hypothetical protein
MTKARSQIKRPRRNIGYAATGCFHSCKTISVFDFNQGWFYVFGVRVLGGTLLSLRAREPAASG